MTPAEIFLEYLKPDGRPERQLKQYEALKLIGNPCGTYLRGNRKKGTTSVDRFGTTILFPEDAPGATPHITPENKVCKDITRWREYVKVPDLTANCSEGWEDAQAALEEVHKEGKLGMVLMGTGLFEQCHFLMGFEDTLTAFYEHPQEMHELIDRILEHRLEYAKLVCENLHPDVILSHDDWGTKNALFMQPDIWREFFKEPYRRFYSYIRSQNVIAIHHADSYLVPIVEDMIEIGIQGWQGILPENDVPAVQKVCAGRMLLMGGIGAVIDRPDATEEEIVSYVEKTLEENCPGGYYIPCITYGAPGTVFKHVDPIIDRTIDEYNSRVHFPGARRSGAMRRKASAADTRAAAVQTKETETETAGTLEKLARALQKGQKNRVLALTQQAIDEKNDPQLILSNGLTEGMTRLGEEFSAGRAFVPEMLMAARCMTAATDILKPYLVGSGAKSAGRVCIGTVKGDMHDIGKNLVKIMMEGAGLEVIDLGCDVSAETFVETAAAENCNIICCSSLLTTTMPEMRRVVELCKTAGIREKVVVQIGGAPTSQAFCNEIGADIYTVDAAAAAKAAVNALKAS